MLRDPVPTLEPPVKRHERDLATRWRLDHWTEPERIIDPSVVAALRPFADGALALMTERPQVVRAQLWLYRFTTPDERQQTGAWWQRSFVRPYVPPVSLPDG